MIGAESHFYSIGEKQLHYLILGEGNPVLFAFHGFGDHAGVFKILESSMGKLYTIISVDLPFHGQTKWGEGEPLTLNELLGFIEFILKLYQQEQFSLAGFSLGGKVALALYHRLPERVERMFLFAPDGLKNNIWYNIAIYPKWGRQMFKHILLRPNTFLRFVRILRYTHIIQKQYALFIQKQLDSEQKRRLVWDIWNCLRGYERKRGELQALIKQHQTKVLVVVGKYDRIIKPAFGKRFCTNLTSAELLVIDKGHYLLKDYLNPYLAERL